MKKYILSTLIILTFGTYVLFQKMTGTDNTSTFKNNDNTSNTPVATDAVQPAPVNIPISANVTQVTAPKPAKITPSPKPINNGQYKDGSYIGDVVDAYYGNIQVKAIISGGKLTDVKFLDYPQDRNYSIEVNTYAMPILRSEAIRAQSANVDIVSGATDSSGAFRQSLGSALSQARNS